MTYVQICEEYNTRMRTIDKFLEAVQENYIAVVAEIRHDVMMNESFEDPYELEAEAEYKLEKAQEQVQEKTKQASKGIIQTFLDFVNKLVEKIKEFLIGKKFDKVKEEVENNPNLKNKVIDGVVDEKVLKSILEKRRRLADDIVREYERMGAKLTVEDLDDLVSQRQKQINEELIRKKTKSTLGKAVALVAALTTALKFTGKSAKHMDRIERVRVALTNHVGKRAKQVGNFLSHDVDDPLNKKNKKEPFNPDDPVTQKKFKYGKVMAVGAAGAAVGVGIAEHVKRTVLELEKQNKLLESEQIRELTMQISRAAIDAREARNNSK